MAAVRNAGPTGLFAVLLAVAPALAQDVDPHAGIVIQTFSWGILNCADPVYTAPTECEEAGSATGEVFDMVVAVYATREGGWPDGIGGVQFGIEYAFESGGVLSWATCSGGAEIPQEGWPASGTGNAITWSSGCHEPPGELAFVGAFVVRADAIGVPVVGWVRFTGDPRVGQALVADCDADVSAMCESGLVTWTAGEPLPDVCGACVATPTRGASWGDLKLEFGPDRRPAPPGEIR